MKVELLEIFGNDDMVANAARVSFGKEASNYTVEQTINAMPRDAREIVKSPEYHTAFMKALAKRDLTSNEQSMLRGEILQVRISYNFAYDVFVNKSLPKYYALTKAIYPVETAVAAPYPPISRTAAFVDVPVNVAVPRLD